MTRTPSLGRRIVVVGVGLVTVLALALDLLVYFAVRTNGADRATDALVRRVIVLEVVITPLALVLALLLLRWVAEIALAPLDDIAAAARRTELGRRGERLRPDDPGTRLGQMALAYDAMLDALEGAVDQARVAETASRRLEERTHQILETAHEAFMVMDAAGSVVEWNAEAERVFGWSREEILGTNLEEAIIPTELRPLLITAEPPGGTASTGPLHAPAMELVAMRRSGERFPAEVTLWSTDHDGTSTVNAFLRDLTEQQRAREATSRLAAIVESSELAILSTDVAGTILTWNPGAERMYGYPAEGAVGRRLYPLMVPEQYRPQFEESLAAAARGEAIGRSEVVRRCQDGTLLDVALTVSPLRDADGAVYGACSVAQDITEERWMAARVDASLVAVEGALDEARRSEADTRRFLDDAAHQMRAPITSIRACAETLLRDVTPEQRDHLLGAVVRESERAGRLMVVLLRLARLGHEQDLHLQPTDVEALCEAAVDRVRLESPELQITLEGADAVRPVVQTLAADAVAEILSNLVDNARRHARSRIEITVDADQDRVRFRVGDDGPGLPAGQEDRAFDRFVSLDSRGGSGLGLAIARELARAHGGELTYADGAFVLELPRRERPRVERRGETGRARKALVRQR